METMIGEYGNRYEKYAGQVWVSEQRPQEQRQGFNVATLDKRSGELRVLGYTNRDDEAGRVLEDAIRGVLNSYGWFDHVINHLLAEPDEIATCSVCRREYHENDVNLVDYEDDVCVVCEPKYREEIGEHGATAPLL